MRFWIVQKQDTVEAIIHEIKMGTCTTEDEVESIAAQFCDTVTWVSQKEEELVPMPGTKGNWGKRHWVSEEED